MTINKEKDEFIRRFKVSFPLTGQGCTTVSMDKFLADLLEISLAKQGKDDIKTWIFKQAEALATDRRDVIRSGGGQSLSRMIMEKAIAEIAQQDLIHAYFKK